jgi:hypothetical protein
MCVVSDKVKFCTCNNAEKLKHYWLLHRFNKNKNDLIVGSLAFPPDYAMINYADNQQTFLKRLNELDAFDAPFEFKNRDTLEIVLNNDSNEMTTCFAFKYSNGKWKITEHNTFGLIGRFDVINEGKFKNLLKK